MLVVVGDQGAFVGCSGFPVVPDSGGHGQQFGSNFGQESLESACAVVFQSELAFEGVKNGFNPLTDTTKVAKPWGFVFAIRPQQGGMQVVGGEDFECLAREECITADYTTT